MNGAVLDLFLALHELHTAASFGAFRRKFVALWTTLIAPVVSVC